MSSDFEAGPSRKRRSLAAPTEHDPPRHLQAVLDRLDHIRKLDESSIARRAERRSAMRAREKARKLGASTGGGVTDTLGAEDGDDLVSVAGTTGGNGDVIKACAQCRKAKTKCLNNHGEPCARCVMNREACVYPSLRKRGRKTDLTIQSLLDDLEEDIKALYSSSTAEHKSSLSLPFHSTQRPLLPQYPGEQIIPTSSPDDVAAHSALHNPLGVLASAATGNTGSEGVPERGNLFWNNIYSVKPENDFTQDPVVRGIVTEDDVDRLVSLYFRALRPYFMHLDPVVHTPQFLRLNSPFLTTALCAISASYSPTHCRHVPRLTSHAHLLAAQAFANGSKSLEVVQAFLFLVHWAPAHVDWQDDRSWAYQGQAMRLACEIRLDIPMNRESVGTYRSAKVLGDEEVERLLACRQRTYLLVCLSEFAMATQSGRADTTSGHRLLRDPHMPPDTRNDQTNEPFTGSILLNHIFARSLHRWHGTAKEEAEVSERERFLATWSPDLDSWKRQWMGRYRLVDVHAIYTHIMLILLALRVRGSHDSTQQLLRQICHLAVQLMIIVQRWYDETDFWGPGGLAYAHNYLIVNIAYGAVLVHKLARMLEQDRMAEVSARVEKIALILDQIAGARMNATSFAGYYAAQIRALEVTHPVSLSTQIPSAPALPLHSGQIPLPHGYDHFDFSFLPILDQAQAGGAAEMWDPSITDPILAFLSAGGDLGSAEWMNMSMNMGAAGGFPAPPSQEMNTVGRGPMSAGIGSSAGAGWDWSVSRDG